MVDKDLFEKLKRYLTEKQRKYIEEDEEEMLFNSFLKTFFSTLVICLITIFFSFLKDYFDSIGFNVGSNDFWLFVAGMFWLSWLFLFAIPNITEEFETINEVNSINTLDFLINIQDKITQEEYNRLYEAVEAFNYFKTPVVDFLLKYKKALAKNELAQLNIKNKWKI